MISSLTAKLTLIDPLAVGFCRTWWRFFYFTIGSGGVTVPV
jgi:hypothetical protein